MLSHLKSVEGQSRGHNCSLLLSQGIVFVQAAVSTGSAAKRTRLSGKTSPSKESAVAARRAFQSEALDHDVKQVMDYADEKVC